MCRYADCATDSLEIINNACSDNSILSNLMSTPLSTEAIINNLIKTANTDWSFELAEMTLFQFPNTPDSKCKFKIIHKNVLN